MHSGVYVYGFTFVFSYSVIILLKCQFVVFGSLMRRSAVAVRLFEVREKCAVFLLVLLLNFVCFLQTYFNILLVLNWVFVI